MRIALYDKDQYYVQQVCSILSEKYGSNKEFVVLSEDQIEDSLRENSYDMYIFSEEILEKYDVKAQKVMCFCDELTENQESYYLFKYQNATQMGNRIQQFYELQSMYSIDYQAPLQAKVVNFFSMGGGMGSSAIAVGTAMYFAKKGAKVLYISFQHFLPTGYFSCSDHGVTFQNVLEYVNKKQGNPKELIERIAKDDTGVAVLVNDIDSKECSTTNDLNRVLKTLTKIGGYEYIILDTQMSGFEYLDYIFQISHTICLVMDGGNDSLMRFSVVMQYITALDSSYESKVKIIYNKFKTMPQMGQNIQGKVAGGVGYIETGNAQDVVNKISNMKFLENLVK